MYRLVYAISLLLLIPRLASAERTPDKANWASLGQLTPGDDIRIVLNDAKSYNARFESVSDGALTVRLATGEQTFTRETVLRVSTKGQSHRGRNALIGLATGAGAGVIVGVASPELGQGKCAQGSCINAESISIGGLVGGVLGAGIGIAIPTGGWHDVYRAR
jgi:hypothetical protein